MTIFEQIKSGKVPRKVAKDYLKKESRKYGDRFVVQPGESDDKRFVRAMRNKDFLVQIFREKECVRLSINRTELNKEATRWRDGITWDELQDIKNKLGFKDLCAVELFPPENEVVNVANIRHLFILDHIPTFMWKDGVTQ